MKDELQELLNDRMELLRIELQEKHWAKLIGGETEAGARIEIIWKDWGKENIDNGYLFDLPIGNSSDEADIFVHIPKPQNPNGMDTPPPVFTTIIQLILNNKVESIRVLTP